MDKGHKAFSVHNEAWYAPTSRLGRGIVNEIVIGIYHAEVGTTGEFCIAWHDIGQTPTARLEAYRDSWKVLTGECADVLDFLKRCDGYNPSVEDVKTALLGMGYRDRTPREDPFAETVHNCPTCGREIANTNDGGGK